MSLLTWLIIVVLILINALYVAAEFAAVSVRRGQIRSLAQEGSVVARKLLPTLEKSHRLDSYIATCQIGITLSSLVLGAFGQAQVALDLAAVLQASTGMQAVAAHSTAAVVVLVLLTATQVVFGELVPKSLALQFPTQVSLLTYFPTAWSEVLLRPFLFVLNGSGWFILRRLGLSQGASHRHVHSPEEIDMLIAESSDGGLLEPDEHRRLRRALRLGRRNARQLMVPRRRIEALDLMATADQVLEKVAASPYSRLPVYRGTVDHVVGILHTKDVAQHYARHGRLDTVQPLLRPVVRIPATVTGDRVLSLLRENRARMAVVIDEYGGMEGILTFEDVLTELVGDVADEFKGEEAGPERLPDGRVRLSGDLRLDEAGEWTRASWEGYDAVTVGGRVAAELSRIPKVGDRARVNGVEVEVERMDGPTVVSVLATPAVPDPEEEA